jgi:hypothetical protein
MQIPDSALIKRALAILVSVLAVIGSTVLVIDTDGPGPLPARTVTIPKHLPPVVVAGVDSADAGRTPDTTVTAPLPVVEAADAHLEDDLRAEFPTPDNVAAQDQAAADDQQPIVSPDAAPSQRGCLSRFVQNHSSRRGVAPIWIALHETVSYDLFGWADVNAITALFDRASSQASSSYVLDREGHCHYIVRESDKPWTQAAANPWSISFEIINPAARVRGVRNLIDGPGRRGLLGILNDISKRWDIPLRTGKSINCRPGRPGIVDHNSFGRCAGGHVDTAPWRGGAPFGSPAKGSVSAIVRDARKLCERRYRSAGRKTPTRCKATGA